VFAEIAASAARLCDAYDAVILQVGVDDILRVVAHHGPIPPADTLPLTRGMVTGRVILDRRTIHVANLQAETDEYPEGGDRARRTGYHTILAVPLIRAGTATGVITLRRIEARLFSDRQIALLETFANQAVIAIENARLFGECVACAVGVMYRTRYVPRREFLYGSRSAKRMTKYEPIGGGTKCVSSPMTSWCCQKK
jgi:two-component system, NtrC family, sensor kinase